MLVRLHVVVFGWSIALSHHVNPMPTSLFSLDFQQDGVSLLHGATGLRESSERSIGSINGP